MPDDEPDADVVALLQQAFDWARTGDRARLSELLDAGCPPNLTNDRGDTLLILAAYHQQADAVDLLLEHGADLDRANDNGQTAVAAAVFRNNVPIVERLLRSGASPDAGARSARQVAQFFGLDDMTARLSDIGQGR